MDEQYKDDFEEYDTDDESQNQKPSNANITRLTEKASGKELSEVVDSYKIFLN